MSKHQYLKAVFLRRHRHSYSVLYQPSTGCFNDQNADSRAGIANKWLPKVFQIQDQCSQGWSGISKPIQTEASEAGVNWTVKGSELTGSSGCRKGELTGRCHYHQASFLLYSSEATDHNTSTICVAVLRQGLWLQLHLKSLLSRV